MSLYAIRMTGTLNAPVTAVIEPRRRSQEAKERGPPRRIEGAEITILEQLIAKIPDLGGLAAPRPVGAEVKRLDQGRSLRAGSLRPHPWSDQEGQRCEGNEGA